MCNTTISPLKYVSIMKDLGFSNQKNNVYRPLSVVGLHRVRGYGCGIELLFILYNSQ